MKNIRYFITFTLLAIAGTSYASPEPKEFDFNTVFELSESVVLGRFDLSNLDAIKALRAALPDMSHLTFVVETVYKGKNVDKKILVSIQNYILPNADFSNSIGDDWLVARQKDVEDRQAIQEIWDKLKDDLKKGDISEEIYQSEFKEKVKEKIEGRSWEGPHHFESPYKGDKFFIKPQKKYILFLRGKKKEGDLYLYKLFSMKQGIAPDTGSVMQQIEALKIMESNSH